MTEAKKITPRQYQDYGAFDSRNTQHRQILSLCIQANWSKQHDRHGEVADLGRLSKFLRSDKSPVRKPLKEMEPAELSKIISALEGIVKSIYK